MKFCELRDTFKEILEILIKKEMDLRLSLLMIVIGRFEIDI